MLVSPYILYLELYLISGLYCQFEDFDLIYLESEPLSVCIVFAKNQELLFLAILKKLRTELTNDDRMVKFLTEYNVDQHSFMVLLKVCDAMPLAFDFVELHYTVITFL